MATVENALISVYDKTGIVPFAGGLHELGVNVYASGGTARQISEAGLPVTDVADLVGGDAILGHRVVTLSREIHAGLLADPRDDMHVEEMERLGIPFLDVVCVDMYPLREAVAEGVDEAAVIEKTDVGGPTMLHSAAKGRRIVLSRQEQRRVVLGWLKEGMPDEENVRRTLAATAELEVSRYVAESARYLIGLVRGERSETSWESELREGLQP